MKGCVLNLCDLYLSLIFWVWPWKAVFLSTFFLSQTHTKHLEGGVLMVRFRSKPWPIIASRQLTTVNVMIADLVAACHEYDYGYTSQKVRMCVWVTGLLFQSLLYMRYTTCTITTYFWTSKLQMCGSAYIFHGDVKFLLVDVAFMHVLARRRRRECLWHTVYDFRYLDNCRQIVSCQQAELHHQLILPVFLEVRLRVHVTH